MAERRGFTNLPMREMKAWDELWDELRDFHA
jgi:hypothetical protein